MTTVILSCPAVKDKKKKRTVAETEGEQVNDGDETLLRRLRAVLKVQKMLIFVAFVGNYSSAFSARMDVTNS